MQFRNVEEAQRDFRWKLIASGIEHELVLDAFEKVRRPRWVGLHFAPQTYEIDFEIPAGSGTGAKMHQPYHDALIAQELCGANNVLEIGTGTGYLTCILSELCKRVTTLEIVPRMFKLASSLMGGLQNTTALLEDGAVGYPPSAPYDGIVLSAAVSEIPNILWEQLTAGGVIVAPVGNAQRQIWQSIRNSPIRVKRDLAKCKLNPLWHPDNLPYAVSS